MTPSATARCAAAISRAYLRHLFKAEEMLAMRLAVMHNLYFYNKLAERIRDAMDTDTFADFRGGIFREAGNERFNLALQFRPYHRIISVC